MAVLPVRAWSHVLFLREDESLQGSEKPDCSLLFPHLTTEGGILGCVLAVVQVTGSTLWPLTRAETITPIIGVTGVLKSWDSNP